MRDYELLEQKGKGRATYYVSGSKLNFSSQIPAADSYGNTALPDQSPVLPDHIREVVKVVGKRSADKEKMKSAIIALCRWKALSLKQLSQIVQRNEKYLLESFITPLREMGELEYTIPDMPNHPEQAYKAGKKSNEESKEM